MKTNRREFIKKAGVAVAAGVVLPKLSFAKGDQLTGLQLYSVRDAMKEDPTATLKALAEMGYQHVEHAGYGERKFYGYSPGDFKRFLSDLGMKMPSGHSYLAPNHWDEKTKDFTLEWKYTVADFAEAGGQYIISPWLDQGVREDRDKLMAFMEIFNKCGEFCKSEGVTYGYHNHDFEFNTKVDGEVLFDVIMNNTDPDLVAQQLDVGNMLNGGANGLDVIKKYPGRFVSMHVKDEIMGENGRYDSTLLGKGVVGLDKVMKAGLKKGGTKQFIIEQEAYQGIDPMECMKLNLQQMKDWGY